MTAHPHTLHAVAALHSLRRAYGLLDEHIEAAAGATRSPDRGGGPVTPSSGLIARLGALWAADRAARVDTEHAGGAPDAARPAPVPIALLDAKRQAEEAVTDAAWVVSSALRGVRLAAGTVTSWRVVTADVFRARCGYLALALPLVQPATAAEVGGLLAGADRAARRACGVEPDHWPLPGNPPCPVCDVRMLRAQTSAYDSAQWTVVCLAGCRCLGEECPCGAEVRQPGVPHIWGPGSSMVRLAVELAEHLAKQAA